MRKTLGVIIVLGILVLAALPVSAAPLPQCGGTHVVQRGETLSSIAVRYGVNMWTLAQTNGIVNPNHVYVGQRLTIPGSGCQAAAPAASGRVHVVQYGENLTGIAQRYGVNVWTLAKANGMSNLNFVYAGQRLTIPGAAPAPAPAAASSAAVSTGPWQGAYYNGTAPIGGPILTRNSRTINFHWGLGSPDGRVPVDGFSARWASTTNFVGGVYRFTLTVDDGAKVWVDEQQVLDVWKVQAETTYTFDVTIAKGNHVITIEYFDESGTATIQFSFKRIGNAPPAAPAPVGDAVWQAAYYDTPAPDDDADAWFTQPTLDFNWGGGAPAAGIPADSFSARWTRNVGFEGRTYAFCIRADDGIRVWVDDNLIMDEWHISDGSVTSCRNVGMTAGLHYIKVEYYEDTANALVKMWWEKR